MSLLKKERIDYFLIWGNGLKYKEEIIDIIRENSNLEIIAIKKHKVENIAKLVKAIYSYDYAPFKHLRNKTKYLLTTKPEVIFIFILNKKPLEYYASENPVFRHIESDTIKSVKELVRDKFNERKDDRRTENHVIHASDNQSQTDYILKYLGFKEGIMKFKKTVNSLISTPYHLGNFDNFLIKKINLSDIYCSISTGFKTHKLCKIEETPHFKFLNGYHKTYKDYRKLVESFTGFTDAQFPKNYQNFANEFNYLNGQYSSSYILNKQIQKQKYQVLDGVHRVSILLHRGYDKIIAGIVK